MDSKVQLSGIGWVPDLRFIPLAQLAGKSVNDDLASAGVVSRIMDAQELPSDIGVMAFNSAI